jgi:5-methyltetrahydropteroyltriglutamate--homocysteine methyltransferase
MEKNSLARLHVDQVGSLLRPASLIDAFLAYGRREIGLAELESAQDQAIRDVVAKQEAMGFPIVSDGEYRRLNWQVSFSAIEGWDLWEGSWRGFLANPTLVYEGEKPNTRGKDAVETFKIPASSKLALKENFPLREYRFLSSVAKTPSKAMLMGPDRVAQMCDISHSMPHYGSSDEFLADVVDIQSRMVGELIEAGCDYVQLDEPSYTGYVDRATLEGMKARGEDPMRSLSRAVLASNKVIEAHRGKVGAASPLDSPDADPM